MTSHFPLSLKNENSTLGFKGFNKAGKFRRQSKLWKASNECYLPASSIKGEGGSEMGGG